MNTVLTQVKPDPGARAGQPLPHAPTLLGGLERGSREEVRVWVPEAWRAWLGAATWIAICILVSPGLLVEGPRALLLVVPLCIPGIALQIAASRRPRCVVTDAAGVAFESTRGTIAIPWSAITSLARVDRFGFFLSLTIPEPVEISMAGYSEAAQLALFRTIAHRARLHRTATSGWTYVRE